MRITISHTQTKAEVMARVDQSFNDIFAGETGMPVKLVVQQKSWQGSTLAFALTAKMGFMSTPISGTVDVGDHDLTIDVDLGLLNKLVPEATAKEMIGSRIKGLLK